jgi:hypothetical protein
MASETQSKPNTSGFTCPHCTKGSLCEYAKSRMTKASTVKLFPDPSSCVVYGLTTHGPPDVKEWFNRDLSACVYTPNISRGKSVEFVNTYSYFRATDPRFSNAIVCAPCAMQSSVLGALRHESTEVSPANSVLSHVFLHSSAKDVQCVI